MNKKQCIEITTLLADAFVGKDWHKLSHIETEACRGLCGAGYLEVENGFVKKSMEINIGDQIESVINIMKKEAVVFAEGLETEESKAAFKAFLNR